MNLPTEFQMTQVHIEEGMRDTQQRRYTCCPLVIALADIVPDGLYVFVFSCETFISSRPAPFTSWHRVSATKLEHHENVRSWLRELDKHYLHDEMPLEADGLMVPRTFEIVDNYFLQIKDEKENINEV